MCNSTWYRSIMPNGGIWTESRNIREIYSEAKKWDYRNGDLRIQKMVMTQSYGSWEDVD